MNLKNKILLTFVLFLSPLTLQAENTELNIQVMSDKLINRVLQYEEVKGVNLPSGIIRLRLFKMSSYDRCPEPVLRMETEYPPCSSEYILATSIGELGPTQAVYNLGNVGEITKIVGKSGSGNYEEAEITLTLQNYPDWIIKTFSELKKKEVTKILKLSKDGLKEKN